MLTAGQLRLPALPHLLDFISKTPFIRVANGAMLRMLQQNLAAAYVGIQLKPRSSQG